MNIEEIRKMVVELEELFIDLSEEMENFVENPTRRKKTKIMEINKNFNWKKVKLIRKVQDFWCKGE